jgi:hypothetical protein
MTTADLTSFASDRDGCQEPHLTPLRSFNRPGLPALTYRLGTRASILRRMIARLPRQQVPTGDDDRSDSPLAALTTRESADPTLALLDAWATTADVLTFYQERIANEAYLRTATERRSILELARAIGYELRPGVAAAAHLAFTVDAAVDPYNQIAVPAGTKIQSIPAPGKLPQTFETSAGLTIRGVWNELRPRLTQPQVLKIVKLDDQDELVPAGGDETKPVTGIALAGVVTTLKPGDLLLAVSRDGKHRVVKTIRKVTPETDKGRTRIAFADEDDAKPPRFSPKSNPSGRIDAVADIAKRGDPATIIAQVVCPFSWTETELAKVLSLARLDPATVERHMGDGHPCSPETTEADSDVTVYFFRVKTGIFGHNAPLFAALPEEVQKAYTSGDAPNIEDFDWDKKQPDVITSLKDGVHPGTIYLERAFPNILPETWLLLTQLDPVPRNPDLENSIRIAKVTELFVNDFALAARLTAIMTDSTETLTEFKMRATTAYAQSEPLILADLPIEDAVPAGATSLDLDRFVLGLNPGRPVVLTGERADLPGVTAQEVVVLDDALHTNALTTLRFQKGLSHSYKRATISVIANVGHATHGETVTEVLGGGEGHRANQRFTLKKRPLTYVSAPTASGRESTLRVIVDGVRWDEAPALYGLDARDECFVVRHDDDGTPVVLFGDGEKGAPLATGGRNLTATTRSGIGSPRLVAAGSLTLLQTRPLGVRGVTNPLPASGAADPEDRESARTNAPRTVLTMDRIVALRDYEVFARTFAGIGKAAVTSFVLGQTPVVHLTIAGEGGEAVPSASDLIGNLVGAIARLGDPGHQVLVDSYQPLFFELTARVAVDDRRLPATVLDAVRAALAAAFSFARREFGQPVTAAEVMTVIQGVSGVVAADLDALGGVGTSQSTPNGGPPSVVTAAPAQMLLLPPDNIHLTEMAR